MTDASSVPVLRFHDVSHWNRDYRPNGPTFCKATQGTGYTDPTYTDIKTATVAGGWEFAAYHYVDTSDEQAQAAHALSVIGKNTPTMWDVEKGGGNLGHVCRIHDAYTKLGGLATLVYLPKWYWKLIGSPNLAPLVSRGLHLVSSNYPATGYTDNGPGWLSYGGMLPIIWQYQGSPLDTNAFRGTREQLRAVLSGKASAPAPSHPPVPPQLPPPDVHVVKHGETMSSIARMWGVTLSQLEHANPHAGHPAGHFDLIYPGDVLHRP